jgi:hypothetical protein
MSISSVPGFDALQASPASSAYAGQDVLSAAVTPSPAPKTPAPASSTTPAAPAATENPYQSAYDQIITASSVALMRSLSAGAGSSTPQFGDGSPASSLSGISGMMDALKAGMAEGMFTGTGFDHNG